jgi:hypothetical protein
MLPVETGKSSFSLFCKELGNISDPENKREAS